MNVKELQQQAEEFTQKNLIWLCAELIEWNDTGILRNGLMRELREQCNFAGHASMAVAEGLVKRAALERIVRPNV